MSRKIAITAALIAMVTVTMAFAGCVGDADDAEWNKPTQVTFNTIDVNEANETVTITFTLNDKGDENTRATGSVRVAIWDSMDFEMLNKTYEVKAKDFDAWTLFGVKLADYDLEVPFSDFAKSHDRGAGGIDDNEMHGNVWFTFKEVTFGDDYDWLNPTIPDGLLLPNEAPQADVVIHNPGYVGMAVICNGSGSTDIEGGGFEWEWDWGDGDTTPSIIATEEESHIYDTAGTYTIIMKVTDYEGLEATKSMDVTVEWSLGITVSSWGIVAEGTYINQTYVELMIENMSPAEAATPSAAAESIKLKDAADAMTDDNGTDVAIPDTLAVDGDVTVMIYFDPAEGFTPTKIDVWGREFTLP
jgi:hypothetical protein